MTDQNPTLRYDLAGFNHKATCLMLTKRALPQGFNKWRLGFYGSLLFAAAALPVAMSRGYDIASPIYMFFVISITALMLCLAFKRQARLWKTVSTSPFRSGPTTLTLSDAGLTIANAASTTTIYWSHIVDVIKGKNGILILAGALDYFAIPANAFQSPEEQDAVLKTLRDRIMSAKGAVT
ncbi:YcxB family protein [Pseudorhodobacter sp.]|uniref:YcxB family protein n=1 Tax=Pseudorhodobacter sp. TaxID=1934400 RepID=UPI0026490EC8|nr:YcxB family protein [Pseudorhodobacter sp.]MDN5785891.1 YcxB family protein [Pseudorhodobacter sp.]